MAHAAPRRPSTVGNRPIDVIAALATAPSTVGTDDTGVRRAPVAVILAGPLAAVPRHLSRRPRGLDYVRSAGAPHTTTPDRGRRRWHSDRLYYGATTAGGGSRARTRSPLGRHYSRRQILFVEFGFDADKTHRCWRREAGVAGGVKMRVVAAAVQRNLFTGPNRRTAATG
jgi:hypothetical protein